MRFTPDAIDARLRVLTSRVVRTAHVEDVLTAFAQHLLTLPELPTSWWELWQVAHEFIASHIEQNPEVGFTLS